jgi:glutathione peroxidase
MENQMGLPQLLWGRLTGSGKKLRQGLGADISRHTVSSMEGEEVDLAEYKDKVLPIVNVASKCGFTPQYKALEALHEKYKHEGVRILGFPCNDFGRQEPGSHDEIKAFCAATYRVGFDLFAKTSVKDLRAESLYGSLISREENGNLGGAIIWNFTKFIVGRNGQVVARAEPPMRPDDPLLVGLVQEELAKK